MYSPWFLDCVKKDSEARSELQTDQDSAFSLCSGITGAERECAECPIGLFPCDSQLMLSPRLSRLISDHNSPTLGVPVVAPAMHQDDLATVGEMPVRPKDCVCLGLWTLRTQHRGRWC